ncbi:hypothetical protein BaRGS_00031268, partial [Batillaria attramentaria]
TTCSGSSFASHTAGGCGIERRHSAREIDGARVVTPLRDFIFSDALRLVIGHSAFHLRLYSEKDVTESPKHEGFHQALSYRNVHLEY